jgi:hypothetical protein
MEVHRSFRAAGSSLHQRIKVTATHDSGRDLVHLSLALLAGPSEQPGCPRLRDVVPRHENAGRLTLDAAGDQVDGQAGCPAVGASCSLGQALVLHDGQGAVAVLDWL